MSYKVQPMKKYVLRDDYGVKVYGGEINKKQQITYNGPQNTPIDLDVMSISHDRGNQWQARKPSPRKNSPQQQLSPQRTPPRKQSPQRTPPKKHLVPIKTISASKIIPTINGALGELINGSLPKLFLEVDCCHRDLYSLKARSAEEKVFLERVQYLFAQYKKISDNNKKEFFDHPEKYNFKFDINHLNEFIVKFNNLYKIIFNVVRGYLLFVNDYNKQAEENNIKSYALDDKPRRIKCSDLDPKAQKIHKCNTMNAEAKRLSESCDIGIKPRECVALFSIQKLPRIEMPFNEFVNNMKKLEQTITPGNIIDINIKNRETVHAELRNFIADLQSKQNQIKQMLLHLNNSMQNLQSPQASPKKKSRFAFW